MAPLLPIALAWAAGLWLAAQINQPAWAWLILAGLAAASLALWRAGPRWRWPLVCALTLGLAGARGAAAQPPWSDPAFIGHPVRAPGGSPALLEGIVAAEPEDRETYTALRLEAATLRQPDAPDPQHVFGAVLVYTVQHSAERLAATGDSTWHYGDRVSVWGRLEAPPDFDGFSYRAVLARSGIYAQVTPTRTVWLEAGQGNPAWSALLALKGRARVTLQHSLPEPHASFLAGVLLGDDTGISPDLAEAFAATSTAHIIAISGFNISLLAGLLAAVSTRWLGPRRGFWLVLLGIGGYALLVGASASVIRAAIMSSLALLAARVGRQAQGLNTLAGTTMAMTAVSPQWLWDPGFQLSALATLGLVLYAEPIQAGFERAAGRLAGAARAHQLTAFLSDTVLVTVAAQITTLPITLLYFQRFSVVGLLANALVLPAQPGVMVTGGLALLAGLVWPPLGQLAAVAAWPFTAYTLALVQWLGSWPAATFYPGEVTAAVVAVIYVLLFGLTWLQQHASHPAVATAARAAIASRVPARGLVVLGGAALLVWGWYFSLPSEPGRLRVTLLEVPAGEAVLFQPPGGAAVLMGGGSGSRSLARGLAQRLPLLANQLDTLVVAAPADDHLGALPGLLERYHFRQAVLTGASPRTRSGAYGALLTALNRERLPIVSAAERPVLNLGDGIRLRAVADTPNGSVWRLEWQRFSLLLAPSLDEAGQSALIEQGLVQPATALLLAESGAASANSAAWIQAVNPLVVLISVEPKNAAGNPTPETLASLAGRNVLRTDRDGAITLETDGVQLWVEVER